MQAMPASILTLDLRGCKAIGLVKPAGLRIRLDSEGSQGEFVIRPISYPLKSG